MTQAPMHPATADKPETLDAWMRSRGWSNATLAEALGVHWTTVSRWRSERKEPSRLLRLALRSLDGGNAA